MSHFRFFSTLSEVRKRAPLVHCLANLVTANFTANALLAIGAAPAMVVAIEEIAEFTAMSNALSVNLGTLDATQARSIIAAVEAAQTAGVPWVLDPVAVGVLEYRSAFARDLLSARPAVIRGNASEIISLGGGTTSGRGVDSTVATDMAYEVARRLASEYATIVAVTGVTDYVTDGTRNAEIANGTPMMSRVTGTGCVLSAIVAAFIGATLNPDDRWHATAAALAITAVSGELAARTALGPGSFAAGYLDQLAMLNAADFEASLRCRMC